MSRTVVVAGVLSLAQYLLAGAWACTAVAQGLQGFSVEDAIALERVEVPAGYVDRWDIPGSPDGQRFLVLTRRGILAENANVYSLYAIEPRHNTDHIAISRRVIEVRSQSNDAAISGPRWIDNATIAFVGPHLRGFQIEAVDIATGALTTLAVSEEKVAQFSVNAAGDLLYLVTHPKYDREEIPVRLSSGFVVTDESLFALATGQWSGARENTGLYDLWIKRAGGTGGRIVTAKVRGDYRLDRPENENVLLSPDGSWAALQTIASHYVTAWRAYQNKRLRLREAERANVSVLGIINLRSGELRVLDGMPLGPCRNHQMTWVGSTSLVIACAMWPVAQLELLPKPLRTRALKYPAFIQVDVTRGDYKLVQLLDAEEGVSTKVVWNRTLKRLTLESKHDGENASLSSGFELRRDSWTEVGRPRRRDESLGKATPDDRYRVRITQDSNTPPNVTVTDTRSGDTRLATNYNEWLGGVRRGRVTKMDAKDAEGDTWTFGVVLPPSFTDGIKYPLVIQTHGYDADEFLVDGPVYPMTSGFAAQALATVGFVVVQGTVPMLREIDTPREARKASMSYAAIINALDKRGWVDRERLGIQGFSRTSFHVKYALTHSDIQFKAAAVSDGIDFSYGQFPYMVEVDGSINEEVPAIYEGALPIGSGLNTWLRDAPGFNVLHVNTPVRIEAMGKGGGVATEAEFYASLKVLGVPTELVFYPDGEHRLVKPREIYRSQQGSVDWFRFWLKGEEDPRLEKAEQYGRWRSLRDQYAAVHAQMIRKLSGEGDDARARKPAQN